MPRTTEEEDAAKQVIKDEERKAIKTVKGKIAGIRMNLTKVDKLLTEEGKLIQALASPSQADLIKFSRLLDRISRYRSSLEGHLEELQGLGQDDNDASAQVIDADIAEGNYQHILDKAKEKLKLVQQPRIDASCPKVVAKQPPTLEEDLDLPTYEAWLRKWESYEYVTGITAQSMTLRKHTFWTFVSTGLQKIIEGRTNVDLKDGTQTIEDVIEEVRKYLRSRRHFIRDWVEAIRLDMPDNVKPDAWTQQVREKCDLIRHNLTADNFYKGALLASLSRRKNLQTKLLAKDLEANNSLSFNDICQLMINEQTAAEGSAATDTTKVSHLSDDRSRSRQKGNGRNSSQSHGRSRSQSSGGSCSWCGRSHRRGRDHCPSASHTCKNCNKKGHFEKMCRSRSKDRNLDNSSDKRQDAKVKSAYVVKASNVEVGLRDLPFLKAKVDITVEKIKFPNITILPDSGASRSVAGRWLIDLVKSKVKNLKLLNIPMRVVGFSGDAHESTQVLRLKISSGNRTTEEDVHICKDTREFLLSQDACRRLDFIKAWTNFVADATETQTGKNVNQAVDEETKKALDVPSHPNKSSYEKTWKALTEQYRSVFDTTELKTMTGPGVIGEPMKIVLKDEYEPYAVRGARPIPFAQRDQVKEEIDRLVRLQVIEPVGDEAVEWCHPLVVVAKSNGKIRICVDFTRLNKQIRPTLHHIPTPADIVSTIPVTSRYFCTLDATSGYWQMDLDKDSRHLTTFITPWGRFRFLRSPMGFKSTGDSYSLRGDMALAGLTGVCKVVDDILVYADTYKELVDRLEAVLQRCKKHGISINAEKCKIGTEVKYVGYILRPGGYEADKDKVRAIQDFPEPTNLKELRSFMGLVNHLGQFTSKISETAEPLRCLMSTKIIFKWTTDHSEAFKKVKKALVSPPILANFDPKATEVILQTDASRKNGLGFILLQRQDKNLKLIQCGSRFVSPAESRYAMIELEALAIIWAVNKCRLYLSGLPHFTVLVDHRPLLGIFAKTIPEVDNPKLQSYKEKLAWFNFTVEWIKGSSHAIPDALSRAPVDDPEQEEEETFINFAATDLAINNLAKTAQEDDDYQETIACIRQDEWNTPCGHLATKIKDKRDFLSLTQDGLILLNGRIIIPRDAQAKVLQDLHEGHQGIVKTKRAARASVYWPGINRDIEELVRGCEKCTTHLPSQAPEPLIQETIPRYPFEVMSSDLFSLQNKTFVVTVDRLSGFPFLKMFKKDPTARQLIHHFSEIFSLTGFPAKLKTDNGPQYRAEDVQKYLRCHNIEWSPSSPYHPSANGHAESAVKTVKSFLKKLDSLDPTSPAYHDGLLAIRNTAREDGKSPAEWIFDRPLRGKVPMHPTKFAKAMSKDALEKYRSKYKANHDKRARPLGAFQDGDKVIVQSKFNKKWKDQAEIIHCHSDGRSYDIRFLDDSNHITTRNRVHLRPAPQMKESSRRTEEQPRMDTRDTQEDRSEQSRDSGKTLRRSERKTKKTVRFQAGTK